MSFDFYNQEITRNMSFVPIFVATSSDNICPANDSVDSAIIGTVTKLNCADGYDGEIIWTCQSDKTWKKEDRCTQKQQKPTTTKTNNNKNLFIYGGIGIAAIAAISLILTM